MGKYQHSLDALKIDRITVVLKGRDVIKVGSYLQDANWKKQ